MRHCRLGDCDEQCRHPPSSAVRDSSSSRLLPPSRTETETSATSSSRSRSRSIGFRRTMWWKRRSLWPVQGGALEVSGARVQVRYPVRRKARRARQQRVRAVDRHRPGAQGQQRGESGRCRRMERATTTTCCTRAHLARSKKSRAPSRSQHQRRSDPRRCQPRPTDRMQPRAGTRTQT